MFASLHAPVFNMSENDRRHPNQKYFDLAADQHHEALRSVTVWSLPTVTQTSRHETTRENLQPHSAQKNHPVHLTWTLAAKARKQGRNALARISSLHHIKFSHVMWSSHMSDGQRDFFGEYAIIKTGRLSLSRRFWGLQYQHRRRTIQFALCHHEICKCSWTELSALSWRKTRNLELWSKPLLFVPCHVNNNLLWY